MSGEAVCEREREGGWEGGREGGTEREREHERKRGTPGVVGSQNLKYSVSQNISSPKSPVATCMYVQVSEKVCV